MFVSGLFPPHSRWYSIDLILMPSLRNQLVGNCTQMFVSMLSSLPVVLLFSPTANSVNHLVSAGLLEQLLSTKLIILMQSVDFSPFPSINHFFAPFVQSICQWGDFLQLVYISPASFLRSVQILLRYYIIKITPQRVLDCAYIKRRHRGRFRCRRSLVIVRKGGSFVNRPIDSFLRRDQTRRQDTETGTLDPFFM